MKEEGWWLVVGDCASGELYALKRVGFLANTSVKLKVPSSALDGELMLYCMSDCYLGLDQQIVLTSRPSHSAQQRPRRNRGKAPPPPPPPSMATETDLAGSCDAVETVPSPPRLSPSHLSASVDAVVTGICVSSLAFRLGTSSCLGRVTAICSSVVACPSDLLSLCVCALGQRRRLAQATARTTSSGTCAVMRRYQRWERQSEEATRTSGT
jgi:hypothetical protein